MHRSAHVSRLLYLSSKWKWDLCCHFSDLLRTARGDCWLDISSARESTAKYVYSTFECDCEKSSFGISPHPNHRIIVACVFV